MKTVDILQEQKMKKTIHIYIKERQNRTRAGTQ